MSKPRLQIIVGSTRPGRVGLPVAVWLHDRAAEHGGFDVELVDLAVVNLPIFDEPHHPRLRHYVHPHTKDWSTTIERGDAYVFVLPEYNYSFNAATKNALDYLHQEWQYKPVGFVSYGGLAGGTRAVQAIKQVVTTLKMVPIVESVNVPFVAQFIDDKRADGARFVPNETIEDAATAMLDELEKWAGQLRALREPAIDAVA